MSKIAFSWDLLEKSLIIDVRSEIEFEKGHIPGAINIPILNTEERKIVGTSFKQNGQKYAILKGLELSGPHLSKRLKLAVKLAENSENIVIHCWRGGMRSGFFTYLMEFFGLRVSVLIGGYKSYRKHVQETFDRPYNIAILGGMTGSGKTHILDELEKTTAFCIDLEKLAHHRGSSFGALGMEPQPSQEQFENNLAQQLITIGKNTIWLEDESRTIGAKIIPEGIWNQMREAPHYFLDSSFEERLDQIMVDYGDFSIDELKICTLRIAKRLGPQHAKKAIEFLDNNEVRNAFSIALNYYDKAYSYHKEINPLGEKITIDCPSKNYTEIANFLVNIKNKKNR